MKRYYIYTALAVIIPIIYFGTPQLTDQKIFINNFEEKKPTDWLSAILANFYSEPESYSDVYSIPQNIRTIIFYGNDNYINVFNDNIYLKKNNSSNNNIVANQEYEFTDQNYKIEYGVNNDTLKVRLPKIRPSLNVFIDSSIHNIVFNNVNKMSVSMDESIATKISLTNHSDVNFAGKKNRNLNTFLVEGESTLQLNHFFVPKVDIKIDNSMVYVDPLNSIDSLKAELIGKSNIKIKNTLEEWQKDNEFEEIKQNLNIEKTSLNIFADGNLEYYNLSLNPAKSQ